MTIFSALLALGAILGLAWITLEAPQADQEITLDTGVLVLFSALIGGRAAYVAIHWAYFQEHLFEIIQFWLGGYAWPGAFAGGIFGTFIAAWVFGIPLGKLADRLLPLLASLSVAIWLGCWLTGCAYGPEVTWGLPTNDEWGIWKPRLPIQLTGAILTVALFWGIELLRHRKGDSVPGLAASLGVAGLSLTLLVISFLRVDPYPQYNGIRLEAWAALIFLGIATLSGILAYLRNR